MRRPAAALLVALAISGPALEPSLAAADPIPQAGTHEVASEPQNHNGSDYNPLALGILALGAGIAYVGCMMNIGSGIKKHSGEYPG